MKKYLTIAALIITSPVLANDVLVSPHVTRNGTYVEGHYRSAPDSNPYNNYSTKGNVNPYTGQAGTVNPYGQQPRQAPTDYTPQNTYQAPPVQQNQYQPRQPCYLNGSGSLQCY